MCKKKCNIPLEFHTVESVKEWHLFHSFLRFHPFPPIHSAPFRHSACASTYVCHSVRSHPHTPPYSAYSSPPFHSVLCACIEMCVQVVSTHNVPTLALVGSVVMVHRCERPRLTMYARERIQQMLCKGSTCREVATTLSQEGIHTCHQTMWRLERHIKVHGSALPLPKSGGPTKLTDTALEKIDDAMLQDDEATTKELVVALQGAASIHVKVYCPKGHRLLGWTFRGAAYCQLIRVQNREKRLHWAQKYLGKDFDDVFWTDETSVQMETHRRFCCCKRGQKPHNVMCTR